MTTIDEASGSPDSALCRRLHIHGRASAGSLRISDLVPRDFVPYSQAQVQNQTETLGLGSRVPEFSLSAANREGGFTLSAFLARGPLVLEFLRGTW
ncbi:MAG TPA: hypothetical protein VEG68_08035 [Terriglobales bacterium]|nr:hypothetical protein [Terriglobales bacterium]